MILKIEDLDIVNMGIKLGFLTWAIFFAAIVISSLRMKKFAVNF